MLYLASSSPRRQELLALAGFLIPLRRPMWMNICGWDAAQRGRVPVSAAESRGVFCTSSGRRCSGSGHGGRAGADSRQA